LLIVRSISTLLLASRVRSRRTGTTAEEQHRGESLDERPAQEAPDVGAPEGDGLVATDVGIDGAAVSATAEEAAVHVVPDPEEPAAQYG
jgi:hypothetical protein